MVAIDVELEIDRLEDGASALRLRPLVAVPAQRLEFTLAVVFSRLRHVTGGSFVPRMLGLPVARPASDTVRSSRFGRAPKYEHPCAEMTIDGDNWRMPVRSAAPFLPATLVAMAEKLQLWPAAWAMPSRLRSRVPSGDGRAPRPQLGGQHDSSERRGASAQCDPS